MTATANTIKMTTTQEEITCPRCDRTEKECEEQAEDKDNKNPITDWCGEWGLSCDECYYKANPESDDEDDDFDREDSCDTCVKGWSKANEFGRCVCRCACRKLLRNCRYECEEFKEECRLSAERAKAKAIHRLLPHLPLTHEQLVPLRDQLVALAKYIDTLVGKQS